MQTIKHRNGKVESRYESYTEFLNLAPQGPEFKTYSGTLHGNSWYSDKGWEDSKRLAHSGWPEGRRAFTVLTDKLDITSKDQRDEIVFDVAGECGFDIGMVVSGEPECVMDWQQAETTQETFHGPIISLVVDVAPSMGVNTEAIKMRGAAVLALCDALESAGKRLEIDAIWYCQSRKHQLTIPLKRAESQAQPDQIAYALAHPAFGRRFCHFVLGCSHLKAQDDIQADIYLPPLHLEYTNWTKPAKVMKWINATLAKAGVTVMATESSQPIRQTGRRSGSSPNGIAV